MRVGFDKEILDVAFSPNGKWLLAASEDRSARLLLWRQKDLIEDGCARLPRNLSYEEWQQYVADEPYRKTCLNLPLHPSLIEQGRTLARAGDVNGAVSIFRQAAKLDPSLKLDPKAEAQQLAKIALEDKTAKPAAQETQ